LPYLRSFAQFIQPNLPQSLAGLSALGNPSANSKVKCLSAVETPARKGPNNAVSGIHQSTKITAGAVIPLQPQQISLNHIPSLRQKHPEMASIILALIMSGVSHDKK